MRDRGGSAAHQQSPRAAPHSKLAPQHAHCVVAASSVGVDAVIARVAPQGSAQEFHLPREFTAMPANRQMRVYGGALDQPDPAVHRFRHQPVNFFACAHELSLGLAQAASP
jgi:hypothetical protein